jgi:predicted ATPase
MPDAANLAAFLFGLRGESEGCYQKVVSTIQLIAPFFADFDLEPASPNKRDIILNWRHKDSDQVFGPHQLSDGTLRAICLVTLLLQPNLPDLIIVDEPELGLHPSALGVIASLIRKASHHAQVLISTQSSSFLDNFEPEDVIVADLKGRESRFSRPDAVALQSWLQDYSIGQVWEKNVIGGGPY